VEDDLLVETVSVKAGKPYSEAIQLGDPHPRIAHGYQIVDVSRIAPSIRREKPSIIGSRASLIYRYI